MKRSGISHMTLMLLVCALPLIVFFALDLAGVVQLNPLWGLVMMILCCVAMSYLMVGCCHRQLVPTRLAPSEPLTPARSPDTSCPKDTSH